jgi:hypothetical protein
MYLKPRKFALLFTFGSLMVFGSLAMIRGPQAYLQYLTSRERLPFTVAYFVAAALTLYCALHLQSAVLTAICGALEVRECMGVCLLRRWVDGRAWVLPAGFCCR